MAGSSLLALIDDIATVLDDIAVLTKVAAKKTTGVLGDDLALNAEQVSGIAAERELPVVFAVAKGSTINKIILVPAALVISQFAPVLIVPLLIIGGSFLCYEGFEKVYEKIFHKNNPKDEVHLSDLVQMTESEMQAYEKDRIRGAVRTDFILSAEIVVITLGTVAQESLAKQASVLSLIALLMTIGVYGLVALIVKLDDIGLHFINNSNQSWKRSLGRGLLSFAPKLMKFLGLAGTVAMFMVGGGIINHNVHALHEFTSRLNLVLAGAFDILIGLIIGALCVGFHHGFVFLKTRKKT